MGSRVQRQAPICLHGQGWAGSRGAAAACALSRPLARVAGSCNSRDSWVPRVLCWRARGRRMARGWNRSTGECALHARAVPSGGRNRGPRGGPVDGMTSRSHLSSAMGKGTAHMMCPCAGHDRGLVWWLVGLVGLGWLSFPLSYFLFFFYFFLYFVTLLSCI